MTMKLDQLSNQQEYALYFDYTGAGRRPEPVAGPFSSEQEAVEYAAEHGHDLVGSESNYFVDVYSTGGIPRSTFDPKR